MLDTGTVLIYALCAPSTRVPCSLRILGLMMSLKSIDGHK